MTRYSWPSGVFPKSMTATEFGWFSRLAARASVMKRAAAFSSPTRCGWMILTATVRPRVVCSARYTRPMPPMPTSSRMRYPPGKLRPMSGSSGLRATLPMGKPHDGQNLCASSQEPLHWGHDRMRAPGGAHRGYHASPAKELAEISRCPGALSYDASVAKRIGELLVDGGIISQSQLEQALFAQRKDGRKLGQLLVELGLVNEVQVTQTLSRQLSVPWVSLYHVDFSRSLLNLV